MSEVKTNRTVPMIAALCGVILLIAAFFLPYAAAGKEYREILTNTADEMYSEEIGMTNGEAADISLLEFFKIYAYGASNYSGTNQTISVICIVMFVLYAVFTLLCAIFALTKKGVPLIVFDVLALIVVFAMRFDFKDRRVIDNGVYNWGFANYFFFIGAAVVFVGAVLLIIANKKAKTSDALKS